MNTDLDRRLARGQKRWAHMVLEWRENMGLTQAEFNQIQVALYGRTQCFGNRFGDFKAAAQGHRPLILGPANFIAICGVNRWIWEAQQGLVEPPDGFTGKRLALMKPWLHLGQPIEPATMWSIYAGLEPAVSSDLEQIGLALGDIIDQVMVARRLSSRLNIWELTRLIPNARHQETIAEAARSGSPVPGDQVGLMMPELLRALTQFTGETWTRDRLLALATASPEVPALEPRQSSRASGGMGPVATDAGRVLEAVNSL